MECIVSCNFNPNGMYLILRTLTEITEKETLTILHRHRVQLCINVKTRKNDNTVSILL